jgi:hypothetical protein
LSICFSIFILSISSFSLISPLKLFLNSWLKSSYSNKLSRACLDSMIYLLELNCTFSDFFFEILVSCFWQSFMMNKNKAWLRFSKLLSSESIDFSFE